MLWILSKRCKVGGILHILGWIEGFPYFISVFIFLSSNNILQPVTLNKCSMWSLLCLQRTFVYRASSIALDRNWWREELHWAKVKYYLMVDEVVVLTRFMPSKMSAGSCRVSVSPRLCLKPPGYKPSQPNRLSCGRSTINHRSHRLDCWMKMKPPYCCYVGWVFFSSSLGLHLQTQQA